MFFFKKLVSPLLFPQTICLGLLGIGIAMLWFSPKQRLARIFVTVAAAAFLFLSYPVMWDGAVHHTETSYPPLDLQRPDLAGIGWVVVLGGGGELNPSLPPPSQLSAQSLARLVEGIRIQKRIPDAKLLLSGYGDAILMRQAADSLGISPQKAINEDNARDTEEQSVEIKRFVKNDRFILVTSAIHMPRAMGLFANQGLVPIPAPADFLVKRGIVSYGPEMLYPRSAGMVEAESLIRESLGILWSKLRGRF